MTEPTIDERVEEIREVAQYVPIGVWNKHVAKALAIIDELKAKRDDFRQQCADLIGKTNRQAVRIDELEAENARLEARWYDLKAENARLKERECFGDADACACALHYEENTRL